MNKDKAIILCGMPYAGKGRMSERLRKLPGFVHISTGELCRSVDPETELGKKVIDLMNQGILIDDDTINEMVESKIKPGSTLLFDGYPRSIPQAEWLLERLEDFDVLGIFLEIDEKIATLRRDRRINDFRLLGQEPRKDDSDLTILPKKFSEYYEKIAPTVEFLRTTLGDKFFSVDGGGTIEEEYSRVADILGIKK